MRIKIHADNLMVCAFAARIGLVAAAEWPINLSTVNGMTPSPLASLSLGIRNGTTILFR